MTQANGQTTAGEDGAKAAPGSLILAAADALDSAMRGFNLLHIAIEPRESALENDEIGWALSKIEDEVREARRAVAAAQEALREARTHGSGAA